jgi:hypothetical protein
MSDGGKGSKPRPYSVSQAEYDTRWDAIFSRDLKDEIEDIVSLDNQETQEVKDKDNNK